MAKYFGYQRPHSRIFTEPSAAWCSTCYKRSYGRQMPTPATRELLGHVPVTSATQARTLTCAYCHKPLA